MKNPVIIFGANAMGRAAHEIFESNGVMLYGYLDDNKELHGKEMSNIVVLGNTDDDGFLKYIGKKCESFVAVDDNSYRKTIVSMLNKKRKVMPVNAIHNQAYVADSAHIGHGNFVNMGVRVGNKAKVPNHCILNSNVVIDYEAELGDFVQVGTGSIVGSGVKVGDEAFIGSGVTIVSGLTIGKGARIGAGSVVIGNVKAGETVFGNPAQPIKN
ncbi:acetyltransferase [Fulvivirga sp. M361]|uniref:NeuD/PglB/VioB family sugar acetyltransferase n=1 Tax=Fulvivirga sp. M361 TaxID=2594266 RepID=UPI00117B2106|nr:NeuD/PglB/VioB family sugar acetyltransferase [Fulvivirga sp. M361]TRX47988.1 acetyltransferase [Fulvivirga sp. M361]